MDNEAGTASQELRDLTAGIVSAYVGNNSVARGDLAEMITSVHAALVALGSPKAQPPAERPVPHVSIRKSVTPDYLISLEDGKQYKSLKRHLAGRGLTPADYRAKWDLPHDYPMISSAYAAKRSELAKLSGLGQRRGEAAPAKRGRRKEA